LLVFSLEVICGKTGPAPIGAVLFGPFSLARKKKGKGIGDVMGVEEILFRR
jgi:hypothetical protein